MEGMEKVKTWTQVFGRLSPMKLFTLNDLSAVGSKMQGHLLHYKGGHRRLMVRNCDCAK